MSYEQLWQAVEPTVRSIVRARYPRHLADDLMQEARIAVWQSIPRYNPNCKTKPTTYATTCALSRVRHYYRDHGTLIGIPAGRRAQQSQWPSDTLLPLREAEGVAAPEDGLLRLDVARLPARLALVARLLGDGYSLREVAEQLGTQAGRLRNEIRCRLSADY